MQSPSSRTVLPRRLSPGQLRIAAGVVGLVLAGLGGVTALTPEALGLDPVAFRWLGVVQLMLAYLAVKLPAV